MSRRTIDYYTNLGLLKPIRSETNYRYYSQETLIRLKIIEGLKKQRFTLDEIKERLSFLDGNQNEREAKNEKDAISLDFLREQIKQLENQLVQLQPMVTNMEPNQAAIVTKQVLLQSMTFIQSLIFYLNEITPLL